MDIKTFLAQEVKPALGCTEPVAVALASALAAGALGAPVERIRVRMSVNVFKNGRSVGLPGLPDLRGNDLAAALGAFCGEPGKGLMVLRGLTPETVDKAKALVQAGKVSQDIEPETPPLWISVTVYGGGHSAECVLAHKHDRVERLTRDGLLILSAPEEEAGGPDRLYEEIRGYDMVGLWALAGTIDDEDAALLLEGAGMNMAVADAGMRGDWGLGAGRARGEEGGASVAELIRRAAAGASEVRMSGGDFPVMSSAGSGNHGITAIVPLAVAARRLGADERQLAEALALSHLVCGCLKAYTGRLTPICGCAVAAGAGAAAGLVRLLRGGAEEAERAVVTFVAGLLGMLCDGGKESCSLKVGAAAAEAWSAASLAMEGGGLRAEQGLSAVSLRETGVILAALSEGAYRRIDEQLAAIMLGRGAPRNGAA